LALCFEQLRISVGCGGYSYGQLSAIVLSGGTLVLGARLLGMTRSCLVRDRRWAALGPGQENVIAKEKLIMYTQKTSHSIPGPSPVCKN